MEMRSHKRSSAPLHCLRFSLHNSTFLLHRRQLSPPARFSTPEGRNPGGRRAKVVQSGRSSPGRKWRRHIIRVNKFAEVMARPHPRSDRSARVPLAPLLRASTPLLGDPMLMGANITRCCCCLWRASQNRPRRIWPASNCALQVELVVVDLVGLSPLYLPSASVHSSSRIRQSHCWQRGLNNSTKCL